MNKYENDILTDFKIYCPKSVIAKYNHKHQNHTKIGLDFTIIKIKKKLWLELIMLITIIKLPLLLLTIKIAFTK